MTVCFHARISNIRCAQPKQLGQEEIKQSNGALRILARVAQSAILFCPNQKV